MTLNWTNWEVNTPLFDWQYFTFWVIDYIPPVITSKWPTNNFLFPIWNINLNFSYTDSISWIDTTSDLISMQKWVAWSFSQDASNYINTWSKVITSTWVVYPINNLPYWKYQSLFYIKDNAWNFSIWTWSIFYIDEVEFIISTWSVNIWNLSYNNKVFSPELTITVKTVWAPFQVYMTQSWQLQKWSWVIIDWDGNEGYGNDQEPYTSNISLIWNMKLLWNNPASLNTNWLKNIYN